MIPSFDSIFLNQTEGYLTKIFQNFASQGSKFELFRSFFQCFCFTESPEAHSWNNCS